MIAAQAEPLPFVVIKDYKQFTSDLAIPGLSIKNAAAHPVGLTGLSVTLLDGSDRIVSRTLGPESFARAVQRGQRIARSGLWRDVLFRKGFVTQGTKASPSLELAPGSVALLNDLHLAATSPKPATQVEVAVEWRAQQRTGRSVQRIPLIVPRPAIRCAFPLHGPWDVALNFDVPEEHRKANFTQFALDLDRIDQKSGTIFLRTPAKSNRDVAGFGETVYAPADGVVVDAQNDIKDNAPGARPSERELAVVQKQRGMMSALGGNYVVIKHGAREFSLLGHLEEHSLRVTKGDKVKRGEPIARVGNSGNTDQAHLHFQLMDGPGLGASSLLAEFDDLLDDSNQPLPLILHNHSTVHPR